MWPMVFQYFTRQPHPERLPEPGVWSQPRRLPRPQIESRVREAASMSGIDELLHAAPRSCRAASGSGWRWAQRRARSQCRCWTSR